MTPELEFYGMMEHIPDAGRDRRQLVPGDLVRYQFWTGYFYVLRSARLDFSRNRLIVDCRGQCVLPVMCSATPVVAEASVALFDRPFGMPRKVSVTGPAKIVFLEAQVEDADNIGQTSAAGTGRPWLHVRIERDDGWIQSPADLEKLGLRRIALAR
jgi:hypothetical protein